MGHTGPRPKWAKLPQLLTKTQKQEGTSFIRLTRGPFTPWSLLFSNSANYRVRNRYMSQPVPTKGLGRRVYENRASIFCRRHWTWFPDTVDPVGDCTCRNFKGERRCPCSSLFIAFPEPWRSALGFCGEVVLGDFEFLSFFSHFCVLSVIISLEVNNELLFSLRSLVEIIAGYLENLVNDVHGNLIFG